MPDSDRGLVARTLAGDRDAFGDLVERYRALVHGILLERVRRPDEVEDLVQDTFCRAYEELHRLGNARRFAPWLASIAVNRALDWWRRREVRQREVTRHEVLRLYAAAESPAERAVHADVAAHLWRTVDQLPPEQRRVVVLRYVEGCTVPEIARFLDVALSTVKWRLLRARQRLGQQLQAALHEELGGVGHEREDQAERAQRILAGLPLTVLYPRRPPTGGGWGWRVATGLGLAATAGLLGVAVTRQVARVEAPSPSPAGGWRVLRRQVEVPAIAVAWAPARPRPGQAVRVSAAGPALDEAGAAPELHYLYRSWYPRDQTTPMRRDGQEWVAEVVLPGEAVGFSFYVSPAHAGSQAPGGPLWFAAADFYRRYEHHVDLYDEAGSPLRGAYERRALLARRARRPDDEVAWLAQAELRRYPDNMEAHTVLWRLPGEAGSAPDSARVGQQIGQLLEAFPDDPEVWWKAVSWAAVTGSGLTYGDFARRFPQDGRADYAAFLDAVRGRLQPDPERLRAFIGAYPRSAYLDEAYAALMGSPDTALARAVADSFLAGERVVRRDPAREGAQQLRSWFRDGLDPLGRAYVVAFRLAFDADDRERARAVARRLVAADLRDTGPYRVVGGCLAGLNDGRGCGRGTPPAEVADAAAMPQSRQSRASGGPGVAGQDPVSAEDLALGVAVLKAGVRRVGVDDMARWRSLTALDPEAPAWYRQAQEAEAQAWAAHDRQELLLDLAAALLRAGRSEDAVVQADAGLALTALAGAEPLTSGHDPWWTAAGLHLQRGYDPQWTAARLHLTRARALERLGRADAAAAAYARANGAAVWMAAAGQGLRRLRGPAGAQTAADAHLPHLAGSGGVGSVGSAGAGAAGAVPTGAGNAGAGHARARSQIVAPDGRPTVLLWNRWGPQAAPGVAWLQAWAGPLGAGDRLAAVYVSGTEVEVPPRDSPTVRFLLDEAGIGLALGVAVGTHLVVVDGEGRIHVRREIYLVDGQARLAQREDGDDLQGIAAVVRRLTTGWFDDREAETRVAHGGQ